MFDRISARTKSPRWKTAVILGTAAGHAGVISALVVVAFWKIDPLPVADRAAVKLGPSIPKDEAGGPPPGARLKVQRAAVAPKVKPPVPVQPVVVPPPEPLVFPSPHAWEKSAAAISKAARRGAETGTSRWQGSDRGSDSRPG